MPIIKSLPEIIDQVISGLIDNLPAIISGLVELTANIIMELPVILGKITVAIVKNIPDMFASIAEGVLGGISNVFGLAADWIVDYGAGELAGAAANLSEKLDAITSSTSEAARAAADLAINGDIEIQWANQLKDKLESVVDENGKVLDGNEELAGYLLEELKEALGKEIEMQDGVIQNWQAEKQAIADLIETKRHKMQLDLEEAAAAKAAEDEIALYDTLRESSRELAKTKEQMGVVEAELQSISEKGRNANLLDVLRAKNLISEYENLKETEKSLSETHSTAMSEYQAALATQSKYLEDYAAFTEERYGDMSDSYLDFTLDVRSGTSEYGQALQDALDDTRLKLDTTVELYKNSGKEVYEAEITNGQNRLAALTEQNSTYKDKILSDIDDTAIAAGDISGFIPEYMGRSITDKIQNVFDASEQMAEESIEAAEQVLQMKGNSSGVFEEIGESLPTSEAKGMLIKKGAFVDAAGSVTKAAINEAGSAKYQSDMEYVGRNLGSGIAAGLRSKINDIANAASESVRTAIKSAKIAGEIKSPSRIMRREVGEMLSAGLALGIEDGEDYIISAIESMGSDMLDSMTDLSMSAASVMPDAVQVSGEVAKNIMYQSMRNPAYDTAFLPESSNKDITLNIYGAEGQDVRELARIVIEEMKWQTNSEEAVYA